METFVELLKGTDLFRRLRGKVPGPLRFRWASQRQRAFLAEMWELQKRILMYRP